MNPVIRWSGITLAAALLAACGGSGGGKDAVSSGDLPAGDALDCTSLPRSRTQSESCCPAFGADACGALLFCAAFDGRQTATCYPERSRPDMTACTADVQCNSGECNTDAGLCRSTTLLACTRDAGCAKDPEGRRNVCVADSKVCKPLGDGKSGAVCELDTDCDATIAMVCSQDTSTCKRGETWLDPTSGLVWQLVLADEAAVWQKGHDDCASLALSGRSDWRVPNIDELRSLVRGCPATQTGGSCAITQACPSCPLDNCQNQCTGQGPGKGWLFWDPVFDKPQDSALMSSTISGSGLVWALVFSDASIHGMGKEQTLGVRCVSTGP